MLAVFRRHQLSALAAWLALSAMLMRGFLPIGYMPSHAAGSTSGLTLVWCSGGAFAANPKSPDTPLGQHAAKCPFAFAAMASVPPTVIGISLFIYASEVPALYRTVLAIAFPHVHPPARAPPSFS